MYVKMTDEMLQAKMSGNAKTLYAILLDKYELSAKKGFTNAKGQIICKMKQSEMAEKLGCSVRTIQRILDELKLKSLIKIELGLCKMYEIQVFQICQNGSFKTDKMADLDLTNCQVYNCQNVRSHTYKPNTLSQLSKPNARTHTHEAEQKTEPSQNEQAVSQNERASSHPFSQGEQGNSRISSSQKAQDKTQEPSTKRVWLEMSDKPSYISEQVWQDFCAYKRERRHNFTATGKKAFLNKLDDIQAGSNACEQAIKNTIANGWQGVFMPKAEKASKQSTGYSWVADALSDWASSDEAIEAEIIDEKALPSNVREGA